MVWCTKYNIYMQNIENGMTEIFVYKYIKLYLSKVFE